MSKLDLDRIDRAIVAALQNDAQIAFKQLAAQVGLAASSVYERVRRLRAAGVLQSAHFRVDAAALGVGLQAMVFLRLSEHSQETFDAIRAHLDALASVLSWYNLAGEDDFAVHVAARDSEHLRRIVHTDLSARPEVGRVVTSLIFEAHRREVLPDYLGGAEVDDER